MEITTHAVWTLVHGMGFGGLYLLACAVAIVELWRRYSPRAPLAGHGDEAFLRAWLTAMAALAWLAVLSGAYVVYPWYRARPPALANLADYPQRLLMSNPATAGWHSIGMEWKEHVAWLAPIAITMAAAVFVRYGRALREHSQLRNTVLAFVCVSLIAAGIAGFLGAEIDVHAPLHGGSTLVLMQGEHQ